MSFKKIKCGCARYFLCTFYAKMLQLCEKADLTGGPHPDPGLMFDKPALNKIPNLDKNGIPPEKVFFPAIPFPKKNKQTNKK